MNAMMYLKTIYLFFLIILSAYFRFVNLGENPGVYNDEGTLLNISMNLLQGKSEYLGIEGSFLVAGRMPLFPWLLSLIFQFAEPSLFVLRAFTAVSGVLSVILLYLFLQNITDKGGSILALLSPLVLAIHPKIVLFNRIGFGYNLLIPLTIIIFWFLWLLFKTKQTRWLIFASITGVVGILIEAAYLAFVVFLLLVIAIFNWKKLYIVILITCIPLSFYFLASFMVFGESFLFDWQFIFERGTAQSIFNQMAQILLNLINFPLDDITFLVGVFGIIGLQNRKLSILTFLGVFIPLIFISRTFLTIRHSYYYFLPYTPLLAIGIGNFILQITSWALHFSQEVGNLFQAQKLSPLVQKMAKVLLFDMILFFAIIVPSFIVIYDLHNQVQDKLSTPFDHLFINLDELNAISHSVHQNLNKDDVVIASPAIAWAISGNTTDYQIAIAVNDSPTIHFPRGIPVERMLFDTKISNARYVIWDSILESWTDAQIPGVENWRSIIFTTWKPVIRTENLIVFENPTRK
ncbi:MAG: glycosyltransferase family 39 protein [Anaerolineaceae bacterium]